MNLEKTSIKTERIDDKLFIRLMRDFDFVNERLWKRDFIYEQGMSKEAKDLDKIVFDQFNKENASVMNAIGLSPELILLNATRYEYEGEVLNEDDTRQIFLNLIDGHRFISYLNGFEGHVLNEECMSALKSLFSNFSDAVLSQYDLNKPDDRLLEIVSHKNKILYELNVINNDNRGGLSEEIKSFTEIVNAIEGGFLKELSIVYVKSADIRLIFRDEHLFGSKNAFSSEDYLDKKDFILAMYENKIELLRMLIKNPKAKDLFEKHLINFENELIGNIDYIKDVPNISVSEKEFWSKKMNGYKHELDFMRNISNVLDQKSN